MHHITVRRLQADEARSPSDFVVNAENTRKLDGHIHDLLKTAQAERGKGVWSNADPEVWMDENLVGRLGRDGDIAQLVRRAMDSLNASIKGQAAR
jgi:hypothetical protein